MIQPLLPSMQLGAPRVDDRRTLVGIFWVLRSGAPWCELAERCGPRSTCYNRFLRWRKAGAWGRLMDAISSLVPISSNAGTRKKASWVRRPYALASESPNTDSPSLA